MRAPAGWLLALMAAAAALLAVFVWIASAQPWLGLRLAPDMEAGGARITHVAPRGPAAGSGIAPGDILLSVAPEGRAGEAVPLAAIDVIDEPDQIGSYAELNAFRARQGEIAGMIAAGPVRLSVDGEGGPREVAIAPASSRPLTALPYLFWLQVLVAASGIVVAGWLLALRRGAQDTRFVLASGGGICLAAIAAATYSTREIALPEGLFAALSALNAMGAVWYGAGVIGLFLVWPKRIAPPWLAWSLLGLLSVWCALYSLQIVPLEFGATFIVLCEMIAMLTLGVVQYLLVRRDPLARASLLWAVISLTIGSGIFVALISVPVALGRPPVIAQGHAFVAFFLVFVGLAFGVMRFRLFDVQAISSRLLGYALVIAILAAIDFALVALLSVAQDAAFAIALVASLLLYLPLRERIANRFLARRRAFGPDEFAEAAAVALAPDPEARQERWRDLLGARFRPLSIEPAANLPGAPSIEGGGEFLTVPGRSGLPALRLHWAERGRALYGPADARMAEGLLSLVETTAGARDAYLRGALAERERISRDMHDNIGSQLLGALGATEARRKDDLVRGALGDLREIVWNDGDGTVDLADLQADLRHEIAGLMEGAGIALDWRADLSGTAPLPVAQAARSVLREIAANAVRHSEARAVTVDLGLADGALSMRVVDDGRGMAQAGPRRGGTAGIEARLAQIGGTARWSEAPGGGTAVEAHVPLAGVAPPLRASA